MTTRLLTLLLILAAAVALSAQATFEQTIQDLKSPDADRRFRAVQLLKDTAYLEGAVPLAAVVTDPEDDVQLQAIAAELNIFLAEKVVSSRRVGLIIEVRNKILAEAAFSAGPFVLGDRRVPIPVLTALRTASRDGNPQVAVEALYAFGTLAVEAAGADRRDLLRVSGPDLGAMLGASDPALRLAAVRVIGRLLAPRPLDEAVDERAADAVITVLNDKEADIRVAAMEALGALRYQRAVQALTDLVRFYSRGSAAEAALDALARIAHESSAPLFTAHLAGRNATLKAIAVEGLARLGSRGNADAIQGALSGERNEAVLAASRFAAVLLSNGSIDPIVDDLRRAKLHDRALDYLIEIARGRTALFTRAVQDPDARIRVGVVDALGLSADEAALPLVEPLARDADPQVSRAAARAVARLRAGSRVS